MENRSCRIGILTLSASDNCGSLLQSYGLQKFIKNLGFENVEIIDFVSEKSKKMYSIFPSDILLQPRRMFFSILYYRRLKHQKQDYDIFRQDELNLSNEKYTCLEELKNLGERYDVVICGSDQIWNVNMNDFDIGFFLPDIKRVRKVAYAASLGGNSFDSFYDLSRLKEWIADFAHVSVREEQDWERIQAFCQNEVKVLADPTLLLDSAEWEQMAGEERHIKEDYIFYYSWSYADNRLMKIVQDVSEKLDKPVYVINASKWLLKRPERYGFHLSRRGGPYEFLNLMRYADLVFVESLHGTVFATIFKKNFWFLNGFTDGRIDSRNEYFLRFLNMLHRVMDANTNYSIDSIQERIEYGDSNVLLDKLIENSKKWLEEVVG